MLRLICTAETVAIVVLCFRLDRAREAVRLLQGRVRHLRFELEELSRVAQIRNVWRASHPEQSEEAHLS